MAALLSNKVYRYYATCQYLSVNSALVPPLREVVTWGVFFCLPASRLWAAEGSTKVLFECCARNPVDEGVPRPKPLWGASGHYA